MKRAVLVYILLVLAPALALSVFAYRAADWDHSEGRRELRSRLDDAAAAHALRLEEALRDAARKARAAEPDAYLREDGSVSYIPAPAAAAASEESIPEAERRLYELSRRGGESFELQGLDPGRAIDAYAFYLGRIRSPVLRARLKLLMARAALSPAPGAGAGGGPVWDAPLGASLLRELLDGARGISTEEGLPVDLLAAWRLLGTAGAPKASLLDRVRARLKEEERRLSTPLLAVLAARIAPRDGELASHLSRRKAIERLAAESREALQSAGAVLHDGNLLFVDPVSPRASGKPLAGALSLVRIEAPALAAGRDLHLKMSGPEAAPDQDARPVRLGEGGPIVGYVSAEDPRLGEKTRALDRRRDLQRALVGLLVLGTIGGGVALVRYLSKERELARLRSKLLANISHELKTPVTSIRMFTEMLANDPVSDAQRRDFTQLLSAESVRLSQIFENLLDFSRFGRKDEDLPVEPVELRALLTRLSEAFALRAAENKVRFHADNLPAETWIVTSAAAVERILLNLLDNALKYGAAKEGEKEGEIVLRAETRLDGDSQLRRVLLSVIDHGQGIPRAEQDKVFEEFYRVRYDDHAVKGSGLGLAIARRLARKLGGDVTLQSREGSGSDFTLVLPMGAGDVESAHSGG